MASIRRASVTTALMAIAAASVGAWTPASATPRPGSVSVLSAIQVTSQSVAVTTSTHKSLRLRIGGADFVSGGSPDSDAEINVTLSTPSGHESHQWVLQLAAGSFTDDVATSIGGIDTGPAQIAPYGQIALTFAPANTQSTTLTCGKTSVVTRRVTVAATMMFTTDSAWGSAGTTAHSTPLGSKGVLRTQYGGGACPTEGRYQPCQTNLQWTAFKGEILLNGGWSLSHGKKVGQVVGMRLASLSTPDEAVRYDTVKQRAPVPVLTVVHGKPRLLVTTSGGLETGRARFTSSHAVEHGTTRCARSGSSHHHDTQANWTDVHFTNGAPRLRIHEQIEGPMVMPNLTSGVINVDSNRQIN